MKKSNLVAILLAGVVSVANADFLSISGGAGIWQENIDGYVKLKDTKNYFNNSSAQSDRNCNTGDFGLKDKSNPYVWVKFIHPIPLIPNVKLQYTKYDSDGHSNYIAGNVKIFDDVKIPTSLTNAYTKQTINSYDLTLFYEIKPVFADIEAGFGIDYWQGNTKINGENATCINGTIKKTGGTTSINKDWSVILPYLYGHVESMHIFGFSVLANVKWAKLGDNHHYDYSGALKYTIDILGPVNPFVKVGYRYKDAYGKDGDNETQIKYKGAFLEIGARF